MESQTVYGTQNNHPDVITQLDVHPTLSSVSLETLLVLILQAYFTSIIFVNRLLLSWWKSLALAPSLPELKESLEHALSHIV